MPSVIKTHKVFVLPKINLGMLPYYPFACWMRLGRWYPFTPARFYSSLPPYERSCFRTRDILSAMQWSGTSPRRMLVSRIQSGWHSPVMLKGMTLADLTMPRVQSLHITYMKFLRLNVGKPKRYSFLTMA